jgi:hypothetical protein
MDVPPFGLTPQAIDHLPLSSDLYDKAVSVRSIRSMWSYHCELDCQLDRDPMYMYAGCLQLGQDSPRRSLL